MTTGEDVYREPVQQVEGTYHWETPPAPIEDSQIAETFECEVCVLGAGISGIVTAMTAAEQGLDVLVMQDKKSVFTQGTGAAAFNSRRQVEAGLALGEADRAEIIRLKCALESGCVNYDLLNLWLDKSGEAMDYVCDHAAPYGIDAKFDNIPGWRDAYDWAKTYQVSSMFTGEAGTGVAVLANILYNITVDLGVRFEFECRAVQLVREPDAGRVVAAIGQRKDGSYVRVNASKGIVICTGGYEGNREMRQKWLPHAYAFDSVTKNKGEGLLMGMWVGAAIDPAPHASNIHYNTGAIDAYGSGVPWLRVNSTGKRVGNEDIAYGYLPFLDRESEGQLVWQIFDADCDEYYPDMVKNGCGIFRSFPQASVKAANIQLETDEDTSGWGDIRKIYEQCVEKGTAVKADTIEELAEKSGIDSDGLAATVARYNELCEIGADLDYGKKPIRMHPIKTPPFFAIKRRAYVLGTLNGLTINKHMQVLDTDGNTIGGLYAAGNASGGNFYGGLAQGMVLPSSTISRAITWGYLAAKHIAEFEPED